jgi:hypothetical protein
MIHDFVLKKDEGNLSTGVSHVEEHMSLITLVLGLGIGFGRVVSVIILRKKAKN